METAENEEKKSCELKDEGKKDFPDSKQEEEQNKGEQFVGEENELFDSEDSEELDWLFSSLKEEKWTRTSVVGYSKKQFDFYEEMLQQSLQKGVSPHYLLSICRNVLEKSPQSIIALYIAGILGYRLNNLREQYLKELVQMFKAQKKWLVVEHLCYKILEFDEDIFALNSLEECYKILNRKDDLIRIWKRCGQVDYENGETSKKLADYLLKCDEQEEAIEYYKRALNRFARKGSEEFKQCEKIWLKLLELIPEKTDYFLTVYKEIKNNDLEKSLFLLKSLVKCQDFQKDISEKIEFLKKILHFMPKDKELREKLVELLEEKYNNHPQLNVFMQRSRLKSSQLEINETLEEFEKYIVFDSGQFFYHRGWGIGKIVECDDAGVTIDFDKKKQHKMSFKIALNSLKHLPSDHIWMKKRLDPDFFVRDDAESMEKILKILFKSCGNTITLKEIKKEMLTIIPETRWYKWWNKARQVMKTGKQFGMDEGNKKNYFLRTKPVSFEEEIFTKFSSSVQFEKKVKLFLDYLKDSLDFHSEQFREMLNYFVEICNNSVTMHDDRSWKSFFLLRKLKRDYSDVFFDLQMRPESLLEKKDVMVHIYDLLEESEFRKDFLDLLIQLFSENCEWKLIHIQILKDAIPSKTHMYLVDNLLKHDVLLPLKEVFLLRMDSYRNNMEQYCWFVKILISFDGLIDSFELNKKHVLFNLLYCLDVLNKELHAKRKNLKFHRKLLGNIIDLLIKDSLFELYIKVLDLQEGRKVFVLLQGVALSLGKNAQMLFDFLYLQFPLLKEEVKVVPSIPQYAFLATTGAYKKKAAELQNLMQKDIPANSKAIGLAQEKGDLRENAEYSMALEEQKYLQKVASDLEKELNSTHILKPEQVDVSAVNPGTYVELDNVNTKKVECYTILGEWESDAEKGIISYKSPFGQALLGNTVRQIVVFKHENVKKKYRIRKIQKAKQVI